MPRMEQVWVDLDDAGDVLIGQQLFEEPPAQIKLTAEQVPTVIEWLKDAAKRSLETSRKNINEVMFDVGYSDTKAFRDLFKKITGLTPIEYRNKYNKLSLDPRKVESSS